MINGGKNMDKVNIWKYVKNDKNNYEIFALTIFCANCEKKHATGQGTMINIEV